MNVNNTVSPKKQKGEDILHIKKIKITDSEMAQWVKMAAAKASLLSSMHRSHMTEGKDIAMYCPLPLYWYLSTPTRTESKTMNILSKVRKNRLRVWAYWRSLSWFKQSPEFELYHIRPSVVANG